MDLKKNMFGWLMLVAGLPGAWLQGFRLWGKESFQYPGKVHLTNRQLILNSVPPVLKCTPNCDKLARKKTTIKRAYYLTADFHRRTFFVNT